MKRAWLGSGVALAFLLSAVTGCETFNHTFHQKSADGSKTSDDGDSEKDSVQGVQSEAPKSFFKNSRLSGALSDEGRDIERSLGVN
jgi:hypothetical protein